MSKLLNPMLVFCTLFFMAMSLSYCSVKTINEVETKGEPQEEVDIVEELQAESDAMVEEPVMEEVEAIPEIAEEPVLEEPLPIPPLPDPLPEEESMHDCMAEADDMEDIDDCYEIITE